MFTFLRKKMITKSAHLYSPMATQFVCLCDQVTVTYIMIYWSLVIHLIRLNYYWLMEWMQSHPTLKKKFC